MPEKSASGGTAHTERSEQPSGDSDGRAWPWSRGRVPRRRKVQAAARVADASDGFAHCVNLPPSKERRHSAWVLFTNSRGFRRCRHLAHFESLGLLSLNLSFARQIAPSGG